MTSVLQPSIRLCGLLIFLSLFSAYSTRKNHTPWLERTIQSLVEGFTSIAKKEGNPDTMNENELEEYLKLNTPDTLTGQEPDFVRRTLDSLDENRDGELNYKEFVKLQLQYMVAKYNQKYKSRK